MQNLKARAAKQLGRGIWTFRGKFPFRHRTRVDCSKPTPQGTRCAGAMKARRVLPCARGSRALERRFPPVVHGYAPDMRSPKASRQAPGILSYWCKRMAIVYSRAHRSRSSSSRLNILSLEKSLEVKLKKNKRDKLFKHIIFWQYL